MINPIMIINIINYSPHFYDQCHGIRGSQMASGTRPGWATSWKRRCAKTKNVGIRQGRKIRQGHVGRGGSKLGVFLGIGDFFGDEKW